MKSFQDLSSEDKATLLKFPVYITLLAANHNGKLDKEEKQSAIKFSSIKTYSSDPTLRDYYHEADKIFESSLEHANNELPQGKEEREAAIKVELVKIEAVLATLEKEYAATMLRSMKSFKEYVSKSHHNALEYLIFPIVFNDIR